MGLPERHTDCAYPIACLQRSTRRLRSHNRTVQTMLAHGIGSRIVVATCFDNDLLGKQPHLPTLRSTNSGRPIIQVVAFRGGRLQRDNQRCSMCLAMNADKLKPKERCASTSNRNFEGRQGRGGRTHLVSPGMAVAAAVNGHLTDVREIQ